MWFKKNNEKESKVTRLFTSESVTEGHPDKICDQISDGVLDAILKQDPYARVACETSVTTGLVLICGEITSSAVVDFQKIARDTIQEIGYTRAKFGFDYETCSVLTAIHGQSPDIAQGVDEAIEVRDNENTNDNLDKIGAGDQGLMFGYATNETEDFMPLPIVLAHKLTKQLAKIRKQEVVDYLRPDGKAQVTVEYDVNGNALRVHTIVVSTQHGAEATEEEIHRDIKKHVINQVIPKNLIDKDTIIHINPTGKFIIGGPHGDAGVTGRKIIVDTYGGAARHGGGAFSGKDATKVDRSAAYATRWVAKNIVAAGLAERCEVQVAYAIGVSHPVSIMVETYGTATIPEEKLVEIVEKHFDLRPAAIIEYFDLRRPIYQKVAAYGHFGRPELDLPWERLDKVEELKQYLPKK